MGTNTKYHVHIADRRSGKTQMAIYLWMDNPSSVFYTPAVDDVLDRVGKMLGNVAYLKASDIMFKAKKNIRSIYRLLPNDIRGHQHVIMDEVSLLNIKQQRGVADSGILERLHSVAVFDTEYSVIASMVQGLKVKQAYGKKAKAIEDVKLAANRAIENINNELDSFSKLVGGSIHTNICPDIRPSKPSAIKLPDGYVYTGEYRKPKVGELFICPLNMTIENSQYKFDWLSKNTPLRHIVGLERNSKSCRTYWYINMGMYNELVVFVHVDNMSMEDTYRYSSGNYYLTYEAAKSKLDEINSGSEV